MRAILGATQPSALVRPSNRVSRSLKDLGETEVPTRARAHYLAVRRTSAGLQRIVRASRASPRASSDLPFFPLPVLSSLDSLQSISRRGVQQREEEQITMMRTASFSPPLFSPVPSPPPPSPASPANTRTAPPTLRRTTKRAVFDITSSSPPTSIDGQDAKAILKERLERSRKLRIAVKPGVPARLLSDHEVDSSNSSSGAEPGQSRRGGGRTLVKPEEENAAETSSSPWLTDSDPPTRTSTPVIRPPRKLSKLGADIIQEEEANASLLAATADRSTKEQDRIEGFTVQEAPAPTFRPLLSLDRPAVLSRSTNSSTSSLSLLFARAPTTDSPAIAPLPASTVPIPEESDDVVHPTPVHPAGRTWNGKIVAETLASRPPTPSTSSSLTRDNPVPSESLPLDKLSKPRLPTQTLSTSASLPSLARASSLKRTRFLSPSASLTSTPSSSPPRSPNVLQFTRRPTCTRQGSMGEGWWKLCGPQKERELNARGGSMLSQKEADYELEETEVEDEESECEELDFNRFQPSIFASHYSNSATSLSSASSSILRASTASSVSSSPKSSKGFQLASTSVPTVPVTQPSPSAKDPSVSRRVSSEPKQHADLQTLRRQQLDRKQKTLDAAEDETTPRPPSEQKQGRRASNSTTSPVSPTSMPHLQLPWKKLFSLS